MRIGKAEAAYYQIRLLAYLCGRLPRLKKRFQLEPSYRDLRESVRRENTESHLFRKLFQLAIGIEAFWEATGYRNEWDDRLLLDFACLVATYDHSLDELRICPKEIDQLMASVETACPPSLVPLQISMNLFRIDRPQLWPRIEPCLHLVHRASVELFSPKLGVEQVRRLTRQKGGQSYLAMLCLVSSEVTEAEKKWVLEFGQAMQTADDIYDRAEDEKLGLTTLPLIRGLKQADFELLRREFFDTASSSNLREACFRFGFHDYLKGAAEYYASRRQSSRWKHSLGQSLVEYLAA